MKLKLAIEESVEKAKEIFSLLGDVYLFGARSPDLNLIKTCDALIIRSTTKVDENLLKDSNIKFVGATTAGFDNVDINYINKNRIHFEYAPGCNSRAVAEYVFCSLLEIIIRKNLDPTSLTCGIIGFGNIGTKVNRLLTTLGIKTLINDPPLQEISDRNCFVDLFECLKCDIITFHVPLTKNVKYPTFNLLNEKIIKEKLKAKIIINTSRGEVINEKALQVYAKNFDNVALVIDVWENEPNINIETLKLATIATPHIAGYSYLGKLLGSIAIAKKLAQKFNLNLPDNFENKYFREATNINLNPLNNTLEKLYEAANYFFSPHDETQNFKRQILNSSNIAKAFDNSRKTYKLRKEFSEIAINPQQLSSTEIDIFQKLGFKIRHN